MRDPSHDPERIERVGQAALQIRWQDGHESLYPWQLLRSCCPCAACKEGEPVQAPSGATPLEIQPVGRYALTIRWSDGHMTGIFSHEYLRALCPCEECKPTQFTEG